MRPRFFCSSLPAGLMFGFCVFLLRPVSTQKIRNQIYFLDNEGNIVLKGPDNPGSDTVVWEWEPHSGPGKQTVVTLRVQHKGSNTWSIQWDKGWENAGKNQEVDVDDRTGNLTIKKPRFEWSGLFTLTQTHPRIQMLKQYEIYGIKVEASPQTPLLGSDVTLSCNISRLSDTVSLHWRPMDSSQHNRRHTDQTRLDNTVYLMVQHVTVEDGKLYVCDVQENGTITHTSNGDFTVNNDLSTGIYTLYRSSTDHSQLHLVCYNNGDGYSSALWTWTPRHLHPQKVIASAERSQPINVKGTDFGNRLVTSGKPFDGKDFSVRIVPVLFQDAGIYTCYLGQNPFPTIDLITVKVTAEPSDAVTEGDNVTLTCSVSHVRESMRLVWINGDGKSVGEKTLTVEEKSQSLVIQKAERGRGNWRCGLFHQDLPRLVVPYYQEPRGSGNYIYFFHQEANFVLKGPDSPGNGPIDLEWRPHSGQQTTKRLATFRREDQQWAVQWGDEYNQIPGISQRMHADWGTLNLWIRMPTFELAGQFTWNQTQPAGKILRQWELFGIKVEADSSRPVMGSDVTLSCTISRLPDIVSLQWKPRGSSQQNRRSNTDQIHVNNTVYLMIQHVGVGNPNLYTWEVQENSSVVLTGDTNVEVDQGLHSKTYTVYRSVTDHSELDLICEASPELSETKWTWRSQRFQNQEKEIASSRRSEPIHVDRSYFGNRLETTEGNVNGKNFHVRIVRVQFADAGVYTCSTGSNIYVTIDLITVTVATEPPGAVTEGRSITLTCSVSHVTESMRLVWINDEGKVVEEEHLKQTKREDNSLQLIIAKADGVRRKWTCGLFHQSSAKVFIPYNLQVNRSYNFIPIIVGIIGSLAVLLVIILAVVFCQRKCKPTESNVTPVPEMSRVAEYMSVSRKTKQEATEEGIHYGSIAFQPNAPGGNSDNTLSSNQASGTNLVYSKQDESVIYAQTVPTKT